MPIPSDKLDIAICTAMAGEMLGLKLIYLEAGSGARYSIPIPMIEQVKQNLTIPLIIGGGLRTPETVNQAATAGADIIVIGNAIEKDPMIISEIAVTIHALQDN